MKRPDQAGCAETADRRFLTVSVLAPNDALGAGHGPPGALPPEEGGGDCRSPLSAHGAQ
jgi:hypothetical protein